MPECVELLVSLAPSLRLSLLLGLIAEAVHYLWFRQSGAVQNEAERADRRLQRRLFSRLSLTLRLQVKTGALGHRCRPQKRARAQSRYRHTLKQATWSSKEMPQGDPAKNRK